VQRAEFLKQGRDDVFMSVDIGDISGIAESGSAALANAARRGFRAVAVDVDDHHRGTQSSQFDRSGGAHTAGRARDQRHFVLETVVTGHLRGGKTRRVSHHGLDACHDIHAAAPLSVGR